MNKAQRAEWSKRIGKAYRTPYGPVRWIISLSNVGNYKTRWLDEATGVWHHGGKIRARDWHHYDGPEVLAPQAGDVVKIMLIYGDVTQVTVGGASLGDGLL